MKPHKPDQIKMIETIGNLKIQITATRSNQKSFLFQSTEIILWQYNISQLL